MSDLTAVDAWFNAPHPSLLALALGWVTGNCIEMIVRIWSALERLRRRR